MEKPDVLKTAEQYNREMGIASTGKEGQSSHSETQEQAYFRGRRDAMVMLNAQIQQARQDTARQLIEEIESWKYISPANLYQCTMNEIIEKLVQSLNSKFLIPPNPVGSADL